MADSSRSTAPLPRPSSVYYGRISGYRATLFRDLDATVPYTVTVETTRPALATDRFGLVHDVQVQIVSGSDAPSPSCTVFHEPGMIPVPA